MKKLILILCLTLPSLASAQIWNQQSIGVFHFGVIGSSFDTNGNLAYLNIQTSNGAKMTSTSYPGQTVTFNLPPKTFDMVALGTKTVTYGDVTITYAQLANLIITASIQENPIPVAVTTNNAAPATP
jgi:uncharacterized protein with beta-barrel porin domain